MTDLYPNFEALAERERAGIDFRIRSIDRETRVIVIAPHGGWIEPGTSEIAMEIASDELSLYIFEGLRPRSAELHLTSTNFDEPTALHLVGMAETAIAIHGRADDGDPDVVLFGGLHIALRESIFVSLAQAGFRVAAAHAGMAGCDSANICNRGSLGAGVQLELSRTLRDDLVQNNARLRGFGNAVREGISGQE